MENLAPAGNREGLERADAAGADAVYLGYTMFSARAGAGNFDRQGLEEAVRYAHARHMRVHVTLNTLVRDAELAEVTEVIRLLRRIRVDGVLVQDLGVLRLIRSVCPGLAVHASTQMAIHNRTGASWCRKMGMRRVVLARECSLEEIRLCGEAGIEVEVFGHGAQCVAVSGLCLFSSVVGERSGIRIMSLSLSSAARLTRERSASGRAPPAVSSASYSLDPSGRRTPGKRKPWSRSSTAADS